MTFLDRYCEIQRMVSAAPSFQVLECDVVIPIRHANSRDIPRQYRRCPYCDGKISIHFESWTRNNDGTWSADFAKADCETEPSIGSGKWEEWIKQHTYMPYVYWLPLETILTRWVNKHYRFDMDEANH